MSSLDLVYNALTKMSSNYARSKKTKTEYVKSKLGGDINIGSFVILHALSQEELKSPEDIEKLSVVRDILGKIRENQDNLDSLPSLDFMGGDPVSELFAAMDKAEVSGTGVTVVDQRELWKSPDHPAHFTANQFGVRVAPLLSSPYIYCYSKAIAKLVSQATENGNFKAGDIVRCKLGMRFEKVVAPDCWK